MALYQKHFVSITLKILKMNVSKQIPFSLWFQFLQVNLSQSKIDIRVVLCIHLGIYNNMAAIWGDSQLFKIEFCQFLTCSYRADLFWVTLTS